MKKCCYTILCEKADCDEVQDPKAGFDNLCYTILCEKADCDFSGSTGT